MQHIPKDVLLCIMCYVKRNHCHCVVSCRWRSLVHLTGVKYGDDDWLKIPEEDVPEDLPRRIAAAQPTTLVTARRSFTLHRILDPLVRCCSLVSVKLVIDDANDFLAEQISHLCELRRLTNAHISLLGVVTPIGVQHLSAVSRAACLSCLHLNLSLIPFGNAVGFLRTFSNNASLVTLYLDLCECDVGDEGVQVISELRTVPALKHLTLALRDNSRITSIGLISLSGIVRCPTLEKLTLLLDCGNISEMSAHGHAAAQPSLCWEIC